MLMSERIMSGTPFLDFGEGLGAVAGFGDLVDVEAGLAERALDDFAHDG